jgi:predicted TIM-barrel fold metal-dependent hydrolase
MSQPGRSPSTRYLLISADCHAAPRPQDARSYVDPDFRSAYDAWLADATGQAARRAEHLGEPLFSAEAQDEFAAQERVSGGGMDGAWDSKRRLGELDADGVVAEVIFPNSPLPFDVGLMTYQYEQDAARWRAGVWAYNRWLADFCAEVPGRRAGVGLVTLDDIDETLRQVRWLRERGVSGGILLPGSAGSVPDQAAYNHPRYEPLWATCEALDLPVHTHSGWTPNYGNFSGSVGIFLSETAWWAHRPFWFLVWAGVFERHPRMRFVMSEQKADWMIPTLQLLDSRYELPMFRQLRRSLPLRPSEYYRRQVYIGASFMDEGEWETRHTLGIDKLMWGSDYPHLEGCWPNTHASLRHIFAGVARGDVARMLGETAARVYGFDLGRLRPLADELGPAVESIGA